MGKIKKSALIKNEVFYVKNVFLYIDKFYEIFYILVKWVLEKKSALIKKINFNWRNASYESTRINNMDY